MKNNTNLLIITPKGKDLSYWYDLWKFRELCFFLAWRDVLVRYKQTYLGIVWAIIRPLLTMIVFTVVFSLLAKVPSDNAPYPLMVLAALIPWQFFNNALSTISESLLNNINIISKIYFPRMLIPISAMFVCFVDFFIASLLLILLLIYYKVMITWHIFLLPLAILIIFIGAIGAGLLFSSLNVKFRDFRFVVPFLLQLSLYMSPVAYSSSLIPQKWMLIYSLNPLVGVLDLFRWSILNGKTHIYWPSIYISTIEMLILFVLGIMQFRNVERDFADLV